MWEWFKTVSGEVQTGHEDAFLYPEGDQTPQKAP